MPTVKKIMLTFLTLIIVLPSVTTAHAAVLDEKIDGISSALVVDLKTGQVILDQDGGTRVQVAPASKILTTYLVLQAIKEKQFKRSDRITINAQEAAFSNDTVHTPIPLKEGQKVTVEQLLTQMFLQRSALAQVVFARLLQGSSEGFAVKMNDQMAEWGIHGTDFYPGAVDSTTGAVTEAHNELSLREMAILVRHLVNEFPEVMKIANLVKAEVPSANGPITIENQNELLTRKTDYKFEGLAVGIMPNNTGMILDTITTLHGRKVAVLVANDDGGSVFDSAVNILNAINDKIHVVTLPAHKAVGKISVQNAIKAGKQTIETQVATSLFAPWAITNKDVTVLMRPILNLSAPLTAGEAVDRNEMVYIQGKNSTETKNLNDNIEDPPRVSLVMRNNVKRVNSIMMFWQSIQNWFGNSEDAEGK
ncbi:MAG: serine hydrolase [Lactobacillaceae bacterium]|jgi:D-alanyl-D-alanine carboxypeptidase (penicillin-binding protein 5/6)|nr:serine hydrolase [Lactobacillaceae bacterium]